VDNQQHQEGEEVLEEEMEQGVEDIQQQQESIHCLQEEKEEQQDKQER
jgi:hypothetical protein